MKKVSIVTICFNEGSDVVKTLDSVISQTYKNIEYIVKDGGSTDNTLEILRDYESNLTALLSGRDKGIYDAMNIALAHCSGDYVLFLNAGDSLSSDSIIQDIMETVDSSFSRETIVGVANIRGAKESWLYPDISVTNRIDINWFFKHPPNHQCVFFPISFYKLNKFDIDFVIGGDVDYIYRSINATGLVFLPKVISNFTLGGISNKQLTARRAILQCKESIIISKRYRGGTFISSIFISIKYAAKYIVGLFLGEKKYQKFLSLIVKR